VDVQQRHCGGLAALSAGVEELTWCWGAQDVALPRVGVDADASSKLDRIEGARGTTIRFHPRDLPADDPATYVRQSIGSVVAPQYVVEAVIHAPVERIRGRIGPWATLEPLDAERCHLTMTVSDLSWPAMALGTIGAEFEIVRPPELVEYLREWAARFDRAAIRSFADAADQ